MRILGNFNFNLIYQPGREFLQANTLLQIYVKQSTSDSYLDPDWPMWYPKVKNNKCPSERSG